jgi:hypothetical protein
MQRDCFVTLFLAKTEKMALLLDLSLRAEQSNLLFDNTPFPLEYKKDFRWIIVRKTSGNSKKELTPNVMM